MNLSLIAKSEGGKFQYNTQAMQVIAKTFTGKEVLVTFELYSGKKSRAQLGFYFAGVIERIAKEMGWEKEDLHEYLKDTCNKREVIMPDTGEIIYVGGSTKLLSKHEYSEYVDRCIRTLAEHGYVVETPDEYYSRMERESAKSEVAF